MKAIESDWNWIQGGLCSSVDMCYLPMGNLNGIIPTVIDNLSEELSDLEDPFDKEAYAVSKFQSLVTSEGTILGMLMMDTKLEELTFGCGFR